MFSTIFLDEVGNLIDFTANNESSIVEKIQVSNSMHHDPLENDNLSIADLEVREYMDRYQMPDMKMKMYMSWFIYQL